MRILLVTNIISPHQLPLARCLAERVGIDNFRFAATQLPDEERRNLGWKNDEKDSWILRAGESAADRDQCDAWWEKADVVLCGDRLLERIGKRIDQGKLSFYMSERWWKPPIGMARLLHPRFALMTNRFRQLAASPLFHYLPIGDYALRDMQRIADFSGRMWRWGYYTSTPEPLPSCDRNETGFRVLWAGRMLDWKRVDTLIRAFSRLLHDRPDATLTLVGDGPERARLERLALKMLPPGSCRFSMPLPAAEISMLMRQHHVYILPSNAYEGWGAVVNEAMAEGCAVIASESAGSARSIIRHEENGLLFAPGDWQRLYELLSVVARDQKVRDRLARAGQRTMTECWSPQVAAERFLSVARALLAGQSTPRFSEGPMSAI
jgi:glycosyltransferase involved in cell wall biosynthesis